MNSPYPIPTAQTNLYAFVASTTNVLGNVDKSVDERILISIDYSQLIPAVVLQKYSFRINVGGEPQLWIDGSRLGSTSTSLTFFISGGIAGQIYNVAVIAKLIDGESRSDLLSVNVYGESDNNCVIITPPPSIGVSVTGDGSIIVNTAPRFFVSSTAPVGANVLDQWYNTTNGQVLNYITNGTSSYWA